MPWFLDLVTNTPKPFNTSEALAQYAGSSADEVVVRTKLSYPNRAF